MEMTTMEGSSPDINVLSFHFDSKGHRSSAEYPSDPHGPPDDFKGRMDGCLGRCFCNKCVLCLLMSTVILVVGCGVGVLMVKRAFNSAGAGSTTFDDRKSAAYFYDTWEAPEEVKDKARGYIRRDRNNVTVWFVDFGRWELDELLRSNETKTALSTYIDQSFYRVKGDFKGQERNSSWALVVNMDGYGISQAFDFTARAYLKGLMKKHVSNFKTLDYAVVINSPTWARFLSAIMRPLMGNLLDKFEMFGYEDWLPHLLERIDAKELPKGYGAYVGDVDDDNDDDEGGSSWFS